MNAVNTLNGLQIVRVSLAKLKNHPLVQPAVAERNADHLDHLPPAAVHAVQPAYVPPPIHPVHAPAPADGRVAFFREGLYDEMTRLYERYRERRDERRENIDGRMVADRFDAAARHPSIFGIVAASIGLAIRAALNRYNNKKIMNAIRVTGQLGEAHETIITNAVDRVIQERRDKLLAIECTDANQRSVSRFLARHMMASIKRHEGPDKVAVLLDGLKEYRLESKKEGAHKSHKLTLQNPDGAPITLKDLACNIPRP